MHVIQKLWINFTRKCLKSLALLCEEKGTVCTTTILPSPLLLQRGRAEAHVDSIVTFPNSCHVAILFFSSFIQYDCPTGALSEDKKRRQRQGHAEVLLA